MGKLLLETQVSIDGYIADENGGTDWMVWNWGPDWSWDKELQDYHNKLTKSADTVLISSQMAQEGFNAHWQQAAQDSSDARFEFADHIVQTNKLVASKTLTEEVDIPGGWRNTSVIKGELAEEIRTLKSKDNGDIIAYGGATLVSFLIESDLIDEYHLIVNPVALGKGLPIFKNLTNLEMVTATPFQCGVIVSHYKRPATTSIV